MVVVAKLIPFPVAPGNHPDVVQQRRLAVRPGLLQRTAARQVDRLHLAAIEAAAAASQLIDRAVSHWATLGGDSRQWLRELGVHVERLVQRRLHQGGLPHRLVPELPLRLPALLTEHELAHAAACACEAELTAGVAVVMDYLTQRAWQPVFDQAPRAKRFLDLAGVDLPRTILSAAGLDTRSERQVALATHAAIAAGLRRNQANRIAAALKRQVLMVIFHHHDTVAEPWLQRRYWCAVASSAMRFSSADIEARAEVAGM